MVDAYERARRSASDTTIEASAVGRAVVAWIATTERKTWEGTASALLELLAQYVPDKVTIDRNEWPSGPRGLAGALKRVTPALRAVGILVEVLPRRSDCRLLRVTALASPRTIVTTVTTVSDAPAPEGETSTTAGRSGASQGAGQVADDNGDDHYDHDGLAHRLQADELAVDV